MVIKIRALIWLFVAALTGLLYMTGNLTEMTIIVFGFIVSTVLAAGIVAVLPWWIDKKYSWKYESGSDRS